MFRQPLRDDERDAALSLSTATREELIDHIHLQRKLIRSLQRRVVELETKPGHRATVASRPADLPSLQQRLREDEEPPTLRVSPLRVRTPARPPVFAASLIGDDSTTALQIYRTPPPPLLPVAPLPSPSTLLDYTPQLNEELSRIDSALHAHETGQEPLDAPLLSELWHVREQICVALRTPYIAHPPPVFSQLGDSSVGSHEDSALDAFKSEAVRRALVEIRGSSPDRVRSNASTSGVGCGALASPWGPTASAGVARKDEPLLSPTKRRTATPTSPRRAVERARNVPVFVPPSETLIQKLQAQRENLRHRTRGGM